jgi:hypothetical protein
MFWATLLSGLLIIAFYFAMNITNLYILLNDGLDARAGVVLMHKDASELTKFFRRDFLENDQTLRVGMSDASPYAAYDIRGYEHTMQLEWLWSWPWDEVARATVVEQIPRIDGKIKTARRDAALAAYGESALTPPAWPGARYRVTLLRENGQWKISGMQVLDALSASTAQR